MARSGTDARRKSSRTSHDGNGANVGFERQLWSAADLLRGNMDASEYKHVVLGLIFLKYISDAFDARHAELLSEAGAGADPEDPDEYRAEHVFWVPPEARWPRLRDAAKTPEVGQLIDAAMEAVERENPTLKGVLPKDFGRPSLDKRRLGEIVDLMGTITFSGSRDQARDVLGRVYEYFLLLFASREGRRGGEFYTPRSVVKLLVEMIEPYRGRVYDPCCGSSGMFVQSEEFIRAHGGRLGDISIYGQESNPTTWRLAKMNLAIRGIEANLGPKAADSFHEDLHPDLKADFILANPPFNMSDWGAESLRGDVRWRFGEPPAKNANFAWVQHMIHHLSPTGIAGFVLANGSLTDQVSGQADIRRRILEADLVDCIVALPPQLFYGAAGPACLWLLGRERKNGRFRDRRGRVLFVDARNMGLMVDRTHREMTDDEIALISRTYHAWRGEDGVAPYADVPGFCGEASLEEIASHGHLLAPGRYVGSKYVEDPGASAVEVERLAAVLREQMQASRALDDAIDRVLSQVRRER